MSIKRQMNNTGLDQSNLWSLRVSPPHPVFLIDTQVPSKGCSSFFRVSVSGGGFSDISYGHPSPSLPFFFFFFKIPKFTLHSPYRLPSGLSWVNRSWSRTSGEVQKHKCQHPQHRGHLLPSRHQSHSETSEVTVGTGSCLHFCTDLMRQGQAKSHSSRHCTALFYQWTGTWSVIRQKNPQMHTRAHTHHKIHTKLHFVMTEKYISSSH